MIKKFAIILITSLALTSNSRAGTDGELLKASPDFIIQSPIQILECL